MLVEAVSQALTRITSAPEKLALITQGIGTPNPATLQSRALTYIAEQLAAGLSVPLDTEGNFPCDCVRVEWVTTGGGIEPDAVRVVIHIGGEKWELYLPDEIELTDLQNPGALVRKAHVAPQNASRSK